MPATPKAVLDEIKQISTAIEREIGESKKQSGLLKRIEGIDSSILNQLVVDIGKTINNYLERLKKLEAKLDDLERSDPSSKPLVKPARDELRKLKSDVTRLHSELPKLQAEAKLRQEVHQPEDHDHHKESANFIGLIESITIIATVLLAKLKKVSK